MKKRIIFSVFLMVVFLGIVSAASTLCDIGDNPNINGVEMNGICYTCGINVDDVCPEDYGADCTGNIDRDCSYATAYWANSKTGNIIYELGVDPDNTKVSLVLENADELGYNEGDPLSFEIYENDDTFPDYEDDAIKTGEGIVDANGDVKISWTILWTDLEETSDYDEFYFMVGGETSGYLSIYIFDCSTSGILTCDGYTDPDGKSCIDDVCNVADMSVGGEDVDCSDPLINCYCDWDGNQCDGYWNSIPQTKCGNGMIGAGEQCEGSSWGGITGCTDFDSFTGGDLFCGSDCNFDTSLCTGGTTGVCGDDVINTGEQCEESDLGGLICSNFDGFSGGQLSCDSNCIINTTLCLNGEEDNPVSGTCKYTDTGGPSDDCTDGIMVYYFNAEWTWDDENSFASNPDGDDYVDYGGTFRYDPINPTSGKRDSVSCAAKTNSLVCPAQIELPFFDHTNFVITAIIIVLLYVILNFKNRKNTKKRKH